MEAESDTKVVNSEAVKVADKPQPSPKTSEPPLEPPKVVEVVKPVETIKTVEVSKTLKAPVENHESDDDMLRQIGRAHV